MVSISQLRSRNVNLDQYKIEGATYPYQAIITLRDEQALGSLRSHIGGGSISFDDRAILTPDGKQARGQAPLVSQSPIKVRLGGKNTAVFLGNQVSFHSNVSGVTGIEMVEPPDSSSGGGDDGSDNGNTDMPDDQQQKDYRMGNIFNIAAILFVGYILYRTYKSSQS